MIIQYIAVFTYNCIINRFGKVNFMQDWRRKRAKADQEPTPTLDAGKN
jgi:hypothetical protein